MQTESKSKAELCEEALGDLVARSRAGDMDAWPALWVELWPVVERVAGSPGVTGRLAKCPDARRNIVVRVMDELREDDFRRLAGLGERLARRDGSWKKWLWTVARNAAVGYVRAHAEYLRAAAGGERRWVEHEEVSDALQGKGLSSILLIDARSILARCPDLLEPPQCDALFGWLQGETPAEIAGRLQLQGGARAADRLVWSAVERLRARFAVEPAPARQRGANARGSETRKARSTRPEKIDRCVPGIDPKWR